MTITPPLFPAGTEKPGCFSRWVAILSGFYLVTTLVYFVLRLITSDSLWWIALINAGAFYVFVPLAVLLPLTLLVRRWQMFARLGLLALLATVWFGPFFQPKSVQPRDGYPVRVVTYNMRYQHTDRDALAAWLGEIQADIVLLQESPRDYMGDEMQPLGLEHVHRGHMDLLVLSRFPILDVQTADWRERVVLGIENRQVAVYNVHLPYPVLNPPRFPVFSDMNPIHLMLNFDETHTRRELRALLDTVREEEYVYIVGGDFNLSQHAIVYSELAVTMIDAFRRTSSGLGTTWPVFSEIIPPLVRNDYIWVSQGMRPVSSEVGPGFGSDHLPVTALIELPFPASSADPDTATDTD